MKEKRFIVYMHIAPNGKKYIGITSKSIEKRWNNGNGYRNNEYFYSAILKYGKEKFKHIEIASNLTKEEACKMEQDFIKKYDTTNREKGFNHSIGGDISAYGVKRSKEYIKKLKVIHTGKKCSEETKQKISNTLKGKPTWNKGIPMKENSKRKMSISVLCVETNKIYWGINEAEKQTGISSQNIGQCIKGKRKRAGGYQWKIVKE